MQRIYYLDYPESSLDSLFEMDRQNPLAPWDSVYAKNQSRGRGQMRSAWISCEGNILASIKLPLESPFKGSGAALAFGAFIIEALLNLNFAVQLKWPNDIVIQGKYKAGGILLEERHGVLAAGVGINVNILPEESLMDPPPLLPPGCLANLAGKELDAPALWAEIAGFTAGFFARGNGREWQKIVERHLLWKGEKVAWKDGKTEGNGVLSGIGPDGSLRLETEHGIINLAGGSIRPA